MRCRMNLAGFAVSIGLCLAIASLAAPPDPRTAGIDAIRAYEGTWDITIDHFATAHSKPSHE